MAGDGSTKAKSINWHLQCLASFSPRVLWRKRYSVREERSARARARGGVTFCICRKQSYCPRGVARGREIAHPSRSGPAGDRRICLRFISNRNWWLSRPFRALSWARRSSRVDAATPLLLWFCIMAGARSRALDDKLRRHRSSIPFIEL